MAIRFLRIRDLMGLSIEALKKNKMRTILSVLGIVIGISTLILVLGISQAAEFFIKDQLASFGSDTVFIEVKVPNTDVASSGAAIATGVQIKTMKISDVEGVKKIPNVNDSYGANFAQEKVVYEDKSRSSMIYGTMPSLLKIDQSEVEKGRFFTESENDGLARVAVLGTSIKQDLFGNADPIGKIIRVKNLNFKVIGVMEPRGAVFFQNYDEYVYIPIKTAQKLLLGIDYMSFFVVQLKNPAKTLETSDDIRRFLRKEHGIKGNDLKKDDFNVQTSQETMDIINVVFGAVSLLFGAIASISLIVGGVGIMNIMYVSVTERIAEIGLRKAVGARRRDILLQFLIEALTITLLGGLLGIIFGALLSFLINFIAGQAGVNLKMGVSVSSFLLGFFVTLGFGIVFGVGPAKKAAELQPIEALRADK